MTIEIPLDNSNEIAIIDECDFSLVASRRWRLSGTEDHSRYAVSYDGCSGGRKNPKCYMLYMHKLVTGISGKSQVDHIDGNALNNVRSNLRPATSFQNNAHRIKPARRSGKDSIYKGVDYRNAEWLKKRWRARIMYHGKQITVGDYLVEWEAAKAYDIAAIELFGEFAATNFPRESYK